MKKGSVTDEQAYKASLEILEVLHKYDIKWEQAKIIFDIILTPLSSYEKGVKKKNDENKSNTKR